MRRLTDADVAGGIARLVLDKDPRRLDAESARALAMVWREQLGSTNPEAFAAAVDAMLGDADQRFPTAGEMRQACDLHARRLALRREAIERGAAKPRPGLVSCLGCQDERVVWISRVVAITLADGTTEPHTYTEVAPCDVCRPEEAQYQREGHRHHNDDELIGCDHPWCKERAKSRTPGKRRSRATT